MDTFMDDLKTKGYAIIPSVLNENECKRFENGFWNFWARLTGGKIRQDDPKSWKEIYNFFPNHGMLIQHFSIGHMQEIWDLRCHPTVLEVFKRIWGTSELTVSFDGASTGFAPEATGRGWHLQDWLHLDQSVHRNEFECVQSWLTPYDVGAGDGTLTLLEGSHKLHGAFAKHFGLDKDKQYRKDWLKFEPHHVAWYKAQGCKQVAVECPKGSMVLWESRTVHAGRSAVKGRPVPRNRMVAYISMMPSSMLKKHEIVKKQQAILNGRLTNHWAAKHIKLFAKNPRTYGAALPPTVAFEPPKLTLKGVQLAGWHDNPESCPLLLEDPEERRLACIETVQRFENAKMKRKHDREEANAKRHESRSKK
jgi:hypothetical protein